MGDVDESPRLRSRTELPTLGNYLRGMLARREFVWALAIGRLRAQHLDTVLGNLWHVLNPALLIFVYYLIFGLVLNTSRGVENFIGFLSIGVFTFSYAQRTITASGNSISNNLGLIRSLQFPRAVLPLADNLRELVGYGFSIAVMIVVLLLTGEPPSPSWLLAPVAIGAMVLFNAGIGLIVARFTDRVRDLSNVLPYAFRIAFYASAIIFSLEAFVPERWRVWFILDPFFTYIEILRDVLMTSYEAEHPALAWAFALTVAPFTFVTGLRVFLSGEKTYGRG